jgi:transcriptional regulator with XRE-family HTH domain
MRTQLLKLLSGLRDKAYRALFVETQIETLIPFQIRTMRNRKGWTQKQLADRAGMAQGRISLLESVNYEGAVNVKTLVKLAEAFDVGLVVRFAPFSEVAEWSTRLSREHHLVPDFADEMDQLLGAEDDSEERNETINVAVVQAPRAQFGGAVDDAIAA